MFLNGNHLKYTHRRNLFNVNIGQLGGSMSSQADKKFGKIEDNFNSTENREASEESHGSSKNTQLVFKATLNVSFNLVVG